MYILAPLTILFIMFITCTVPHIPLYQWFERIKWIELCKTFVKLLWQLRPVKLMFLTKGGCRFSNHSTSVANDSYYRHTSVCTSYDCKNSWILQTLHSIILRAYLFRMSTCVFSKFLPPSFSIISTLISHMYSKAK
jgi:hypothetical protein